MKNYLILVTLALLACSCSWLQSALQPMVEVASDPEVQEHAGGVVQGLITGNWLGALTSFGELVFAGGAVYKATMMRRDSLRKVRGEAVGGTAQG